MAKISSTSIGNTTSQRGYSEVADVNHLTRGLSGANFFERDNLGRMRHLMETVQGTSHDVHCECDLGGRLKTAARDGVTTTYTYDVNGNRTSVLDSRGSRGTSICTSMGIR